MGHCWDVLRALSPLIRPHADRRFLEQTQASMVQWNTLIEARGTRTDVPMKPQVAVRALNEFPTDDAIICCDTGTVTTWVARHIAMKGNMEFLPPAPSQPWRMDYPTASAQPSPIRDDRSCIAGDGGFSMLMSELATLVKHALPVKMIVLKNNLLGMIKWEQLAFEGNPQFGVELQPIDFAACARSCGATGFSVDDPAQLHDVYRQAFAHPGPVVVEAVIDPMEALPRQDHDGAGVAIRQSGGTGTGRPVGLDENPYGQQDS